MRNQGGNHDCQYIRTLITLQNIILYVFIVLWVLNANLIILLSALPEVVAYLPRE